jgi:hypothetical protein
MEKRFGHPTIHEQVHDHAHDHEHGSSVWYELVCHFPYAVFSVALCLIMLSLMSFFTREAIDIKVLKKGYKILFHSFHFMHIVFAATGNLITYFRFSKNIVVGLLTGIVTTVVFCTVSDSVLPYLGGRLLGVDMHWHMCFFTELPNVLPFLAVGLLNGFLMSRHHSSRQSFYSFSSHFIHIFVSALASSFYLVAHGYYSWYNQIGFVFLMLIGAVVVPCTLADVVLPMYFGIRAKGINKK